MINGNFSLYVLLCVMLIFLIGCAKRPDEEIKIAEDAISNARQAGAEKWASSTFQSALNNYNEAIAMVDQKKYKESIPLLQATVGIANKAIEEAGLAIKAEEERIAAEAKKKAAETADTDTPKEEKSAPATHTVRRGENLWSIAGYDAIYNNSWKWQRIYDANRNKIEDPDLIYPEQVLMIPR